MEKKGISAVVATILILMVSVIAVVMVWQILKPALKGTVEKVTFSCINIDLSIPEADCTAASEKLKITLNSGQIVELKVLFYDSNGTSIGNPQNISNVPVELGTKVYSVSDLDFTPNSITPSAVNVAGVIESESGTKITCGLALPEPRSC